MTDEREPLMQKAAARLLLRRDPADDVDPAEAVRAAAGRSMRRLLDADPRLADHLETVLAEAWDRAERDRDAYLRKTEPLRRRLLDQAATHDLELEAPAAMARLRIGLSDYLRRLEGRDGRL
jgi:hypothetical protein